MKNRAILLLLGLLIISSFVFSQASKDTVQESSIYPQFHGAFSVDESWQIHKEAYKKQIIAEGLSEKEVNQKMQEYEKQKEEFLERVKEQKEVAKKQRLIAEVQRQKAKEQRKLAKVQRQKAHEQRKLAQIQRQESKKHRQKANEQRKLADIQREKSKEQRKLAAVQREKAGVQRKEAAKQRKIADEQRKKAVELRKSIKKLKNENFNMTGKDSKIKSVEIVVSKKNTLFFNIDGDINSGKVLIEIFNPKGKKEGDLSLEHQKESVFKRKNKFTGSTSGSLNKTINTPEIGTWLVKVTPEKTKGNISISVAQFEKPTADE